MLNYTLGTIEASEALIKDLYIDLRAKVNAWSKITQQTPQVPSRFMRKFVCRLRLSEVSRQ